MIAPLLQTKLAIPPCRTELVPRRRLMEMLQAGLACRLTLVSAPAGFGKTTLLSVWAHALQESETSDVAWLSLGRGDNDPARFLAYVVAALRCVEPGIGQGMLSALRAPRPPQLNALLASLINDLAARPGPVVLVLDDYHTIDAQAIHDIVTRLLDHQPPQLHLAVATRSDPPLPIARLRGHGQLTEVRQLDLRFAPDEAAEFFHRTLAFELPAASVRALSTRTEGWIAGLQLAALALRGTQQQPRPDPGAITAFVRAFTGSHRLVLDYLIEEVLARQSPAIQSFLLQTSILERMTGPLCDYLLGPDRFHNSQQVLEYLEQENLFIVSLGDERRWYRYHQLFADLLRQRLQQTQPERVIALHQRASTWYEQHQFAAEAIDHALNGGDTERALQLVEQNADAVMLRSEVATLRRWLAELPTDQVRARPLLVAYDALIMVISGQPLEVAESRLAEAQECDTAGTIRGEVAAFRALLATYHGQVQESAALSEKALELLPPDRHFFRSYVTGFLGLAYLYQGEITAATATLERAVEIGQRTSNVTITVLALCHLAELGSLRGQVGETQAYYQRALDLARDEQGRPEPIAGMAHIGLGRLLTELNELEAARRHLETGLDLINRWGQAGAIGGYLGLAYVEQAEGDYTAVRDTLETARHVAEQFDAMELDDLHVAATRALLDVMGSRHDRSRLDAAWQWVEARGFHRVAGSDAWQAAVATASFSETIEYAIVAEVYLARGQPDAALDAVRPLLRRAETRGWVFLVRQALATKALAHQARGELDQALSSLSRLLALAKPQGWVRTFVNAGPPMAKLLRRAASRGIEPPYVSRLLAAFEDRQDRETGAGAPARERQPLIDPLTERELEVLRLLATRLSTQEIADRLFVTVSTVRSHTKNIYSKLNVHSREAATGRGRELQLI
ncbi:MAG: LuxR C-terminal-related transcriptional regulator [Anaerolineae bacterium]|jgi:LuxR family maltose regulon positive regulatory protein